LGTEALRAPESQDNHFHAPLSSIFSHSFFRSIYRIAPLFIAHKLTPILLSLHVAIMLVSPIATCIINMPTHMSVYPYYRTHVAYVNLCRCTLFRSDIMGRRSHHGSPWYWSLDVSHIRCDSDGRSLRWFDIFNHCK